jgi:hypothetical protein
MSEYNPLYKFNKYKPRLENLEGPKKIYNLFKNSKMEQIEYPEIKLDYQFNQYGFRTSDWTDNKEECYVAIGSSDTFGFGIPEEDRWSNLIEKHTGVTVYNLGYNGGSADTVTRLAMGWLHEIRPTKVFTSWPPNNRWECAKSNAAGDKNVKIHMPAIIYNNIDKTPRPGWFKYCLSYLGEDFNSEINTKRNIHTMKGLCRELYMECYSLEYDVHRDIDVNKSRDGRHNGQLYHRAIADEFISLLDK